MSVLTNASVEHTAIGRIVIPANVPPGFRLFYTTADFDGCVDDRIREFVRPAKLFSCHQVHGIRVEDRQSCLSGQAGLPVLHEPARVDHRSEKNPQYVDRTLGSKPHVDVPAMTIDVLRERRLENIVDTELCTRCPGSFFHSYRHDKKSGRNLAIVGR